MNLHKHFLGYSNTPILWNSNHIEDLDQFKPSGVDCEPKKFSIDYDQVRLGKLIEQFVFIQLESDPSTQLIAKNLQIIQDKITLGELDCVFKNLEIYIHLEIVFKFYLYDDEQGPTEIDNWVGPNQKDSFKFKLDKLKNKQLPILKHPKTKEILSDLLINPKDISSKVLFKAQLFIPKYLEGKVFENINNDCIIGYYIGMAEFQESTDCEFYMPIKLDWLIEPHIEVQWCSHKAFAPYLELEINQSRSPLCWVKKPDGYLEKIFIVFWR